MSSDRMAVVRATRRLVALSLLVLCVLALCVPLADAQSSFGLAVTLDPALPVVDVQFLATPAVASGTQLFVSLSNTTCKAISAKCIVGDQSSAAYFTATTCKFTVTNKAVANNLITSSPVPMLYWCAKAPSATTWQTAPLVVNRVMANPAYVLKGVSSATVHFNDATPVNTKVLLLSGSSNCPSNTGQNYVTLDSTRNYPLQIAPTNPTSWYVCASVPVVQSGAIVSYTPIKTMSVVVTQVVRHDIDVTKGYTNGEVSVNWLGDPNKHATLSTSNTCNSFVQDPQQAGGTQIDLTVYASPGVYYFCIESDGSGVYVPANQMFTVNEYQMLPQTVYTWPTSMSVTILGPNPGTPSMEMRFIDTDEDCNDDNAVSAADWATVGSQWTAPTMGSFSACVRQVSNQVAVAGTIARAAIITSYTPPTLNAPANLLYGFGATVSLTGVFGSTAVTVGIALDDSCKVLTQGTVTVPPTATEATVTLTVPYDAQQSKPRYSVCLSPPSSASAPDPAPFFYSVTTIQPQHYNFSYDPLFAQTSFSLQLDPGVKLDAGSLVKLMPPTASCNDAPAADNHNCFIVTSAMSALSNVVFASTGAWKACLHVAGDGATCSSPASTTSFTQIATLTVYGQAQFTPSSALSALPSPITIAQLQPQASVTVSTSPTCPSPAPLVTAQADRTGTATLSVLAASTGTLTVCSTYSGQANGSPTAPIYRAAGTIAVVAPRLAPPSRIVAEREVRVNFDVPAACLLANRQAYLFDASTTSSCPDSPTNALSADIQADANCSSGSSAAPASAVFSNIVSGTTYLVCIYATGDLTKHSAAGTLEVVAPMTMTSTPDIPVVGLPASFQFSGRSWQALVPSYFIALRGGSTSSCASFDSGDIVGQGTISSSTGLTQAIQVPRDASTLLICVSAQPPQSGSANALQGYTYGGTVTAYPFTALTRYAALQRVNSLQGWPTSPEANLFLAPCSGTQCTVLFDNGPCQAAGPIYHTSSSQPLDGGASTGSYLLCRSSTINNAIVGSNTTLQVVSAWSMTMNEASLHWYVPASVTLQGITPQALLRAQKEAPSRQTARMLAASAPGAATWSGMELCIQDASLGCAAAASTGQCGGQSLPIHTGDNTITITDLALPASVSLCLRPGPYDSFEMLQTTLQPYVSPGAVVAGAATTLHTLTPTTTSPGASTAVQAKLSSAMTCLDRVSSAQATVVQQAVTLTLPSCDSATGALTQVYYCETNGQSGTSFSARGLLTVLRPTACGSTPASIHAVTTDPGVTITDFGVDSAVLTRPSVSTTADCATAATAPLTAYSPKLNDQPLLYVCAHAIADPTVIFTTAQPTLTVRGWSITPTAARSAAAGIAGVQSLATTMQSNFRVPDTDAFLSTALDCSMRTYSAPGLATAQAAFSYTTSGLTGPLYVCIRVAAQSSAPFAIAEFLSVAPPTVSRQSPQLMYGTTLRATLEVYGQAGQDPVYSMQPGEDASWPYSRFFLSSSRTVYLATAGCATSLTTPVDVDASSQVAIETRGIASGSFASGAALSLCANTPAGTAEATVLPTIPGTVYPTKFTAGTVDAAIYIPLVRSTALWLVPVAAGATGGGDCTQPASGIRFATNAEGYANVTLRSPDTQQPAAAGRYAVCYANAQYTLDPIDVYPVEHFDIRGTTFVLGVPATVELLGDLTSSKLLKGFATTTACTETTTQYGSWTANSADGTDKTISVTAVKPANGLYLCAQAANTSLIALPSAGAAPILFTTSVLFPNANTLDTCAAIDIAACYGPGPTQQTLVDGTLEVVAGDCCDNVSDPLRVVVGSASMRTGHCSLTLNPNNTVHAADYLYSVCVRRSSDPAYCPTVSRVKISTDCQDNIVNGRSKMAGWLIAVIVISIVLGLMLIALIIYLIWRFCCANKKKKQAAGKLNGQLVALRQMEVGDDDEYSFGTEGNGGSMAGNTLRNGSLASNRHPLLYYPRPSQELQSGLHSQSIGNFPRSVSQSQVASSAPSRYNTLVESIEDDERDQIALQEARERYHMRLHFNDELERLRVHEKEADLYHGEYVPEDDEEDVLATNVRPELKRVVETIDVDPTETTVPVKDATRHYDEETEENKEAAAAGTTPALTESAVEGERRHVRTQSIESSRPSTPEQRTSLNLYEDEILQRDALEKTPEHAVEVVTPAAQRKSDTFNALSLDLAPTAAVPEGGEEAAATTASKPKKSPQPHESSAEPQSDVNYTKIGKEASLTSSSSSVSQLVHMLNITPGAQSAPAEPEELSAEAQAASDAAAAAVAAAKARPHARFEQPVAQTVSGQPRTAANSARPEDEDEEEMNELSYTTTQRFYDETRFFIEQEDIRRQRLSNWEEEERAQLAEAELAGYMMAINSQLMPQAPGAALPGHNTSSDSSSSPSTHQSSANHSGAGHSSSGHEDEGDNTQATARPDEALYHAPRDPAAPPARKRRSSSRGRANRASSSGAW